MSRPARGVYRERLGNDEETAALAEQRRRHQDPIAGPIRARVDYRVFNLKGHPRHNTMQRIYAGLNLAF